MGVPNDENAPNDKESPDTQDDERVPRGTGYPKKGLAGKIQRTQTTAPPDVPTDDLLILRVAWEAFERDEDPAVIWTEEAP